MLVSHYCKPDQANESFSRFCELGRASPLGTLMWKPHQSESLHILLRHTGQTGPSLVLILIVILASLLTLNPARAPPPPPKIHAPIVIDGNGGFTDQNGVTSGNGTASNPYVIEGWNITTDGTTGVTISNTDAYFMIRNVGIETNAAFLWTQPGVNITSVANANVESTTNGRDHYSERSSIAVVSSENLIVDNDIAS